MFVQMHVLRCCASQLLFKEERTVRLPIITAAVLTALLAACSSTPTQTAAPSPAPAPASTSTAAAPAPAPTPAAVAAPQAMAAHLDPSNPIYRERSVYFDFDDSTIRGDYSALIERHGRYLGDNAALKVKVEGHTDERGSSEYNLALGQRRAEAVKKALQIAGAKDAQIEAISFGKEKPKAAGHDEASWAQNRRADIVYR
jgi:peptidoglycan-associated lipoprotein